MKPQLITPGSLLASALAALLTATPEAALATEADDHKEAARLFTEGEQHYDQRRYEEARKAWTRSLEKVVRHSTACNLAAVEQKLGEPLSAARHYQLCIDEMPADEPKEFRARARKKLDEVRLEVGTLELEAPAGATVRVNGAAVSSKSRIAYVPPGSHEIEVERDGRRVSKRVTLGKGETQRVSLDVPSPPSAPGPTRAASPAPGPATAATAEATPDASTATPATRVAGYVTLVGAVSAAAAGALLVGLGVSKGDTAAALREGFSSSSCAAGGSPRCDALRAAVGEGRDFVTAGAALLGAAGALGGLSLGLSLAKPSTKRHEPTTLRLSPMVGPAGAFVGASLAF